MDMDKNPRGFSSDNHAGIHPEILDAICAANVGHVHAYGEDPYTLAAIKKFREHFGNEAAVFFVFNGTAANVLSLAGITRSYNAVICAETSHLVIDESTAPEVFAGCRLLPVPSDDGKLSVESIRVKASGFGNPHQVQPKVVSIAQTTEQGTVYSQDEIRPIAEFVHRGGMLLHMDGARLANAAAALGMGLRQITSDVGVDVLSFGGTKSGMMLGEAIVVFDKAKARDFPYIQKQGLQLASKMRFLSAQFEAFLSNDLWLRNARHANRMARLLADQIADVPEIRITQKVDANAVFVQLPQEVIPRLQEAFSFHVLDEENRIARWMASFDTTEEDVLDFVKVIKRTVG